ncbi:hypothetical protein [Endozoicomonas acroporae]|uniref:hypothetical protein n=1 Tax=Endozoicomonas acroporae TaxID=1701104 RepID=UPI003D7A23A9
MQTTISSCHNTPSAPEPQAAGQPLPENISVNSGAVKETVSRYIIEHQKIPLSLRTVLKLTSEACLSLLKKIPSGGTVSEKKEAIHRMVEEMIYPDLPSVKLQEIDDLFKRLPLVAKKLEYKDIHTSEFIHRREVSEASNESLTCVKLGYLSFNVYDKIDSIKSRIKVINKVTQWVCDYLQKLPDSRVTFISMGAGALLMEQLIHQQITKSGVSDKKIAWRCIDIDYEEDSSRSPAASPTLKDVRKQFIEGKNVRFFTTATTYLNKKLNGQQLRTTDKKNSAIVILEFNPPTPTHGNSQEIACNTGGYIVSGAPCEIAKANSVFLLIGAEDQHSDLKEFVGELDSSKSWMSSSMQFIKVSINVSGEPEVYLSEYYKEHCEKLGWKFKSILLFHLNQQKAISSPIIRAEKALNELKEFILQTGWSAQVFAYSEYSDSIDQLTRHFYSGQQDSIDRSPGALFKLQHKQITITDSADFAALSSSQGAV